jgi:hypothetical protein
MYIDKEDVFLWALTVAGISALGLGLTFGVVSATADKTPNKYYIERQGTAKTACVYAAADWVDDSAVFCSDDNQRLFDFAEKANATLRK